MKSIPEIISPENPIIITNDIIQALLNEESTIPLDIQTIELIQRHGIYEPILGNPISLVYLNEYSLITYEKKEIKN